VSAARITSMAATCATFADHHGLPLPGHHAVVALDGERAAGGFGTVHPVAALDGAVPARPLLAKLFDPDALAAGGGPTPVVDLLAMLFAALETHGDAAWPDAVLALPYHVCHAEVDGLSRLIALMLDLGALGYEEPPFADRAHVPAYLRRPARERVALAHRMAARVALLSDVGLVHGDLNPENLLVNMSTLDVQVIDLDSGVVLVTGDERPRTAGKPDECMPPEVKGVDPRGPSADPGLYTAEAERWSHGSLIGYCLFGVHPGFFLRAISRTAIEAYAAQPQRWPEIDRSGPLFTTIPQNRSAYARMLDGLRELPLGTRDLLAALFRAGLDGAARPRPEEWRDTLAGLQRPPVIEVLAVDQDIVLEGDDVAITWSVPNAAFVELRPGGRQAAEGRVVVTARETMRVELDAFNDYGADSARGPLVLVAPLPKLGFVAVPDFPGLRIGVEVPLAPEPVEALQGSPARRPPVLAPTALIGPPLGDTGAVRAGVLPVPPRFTDLLAPLRFGDRARSLRRFWR
jgi:hypothetical protein